MQTTIVLPSKPDLDLHKAVSDNRLVGLWRLMSGYRLTYLGAAVSLGIAATSKMLTYMLLRYLVDEVLIKGHYGTILMQVALGFVGLALFEGTFSFASGRLAALTAEGITRRLRNYLFDHIQRLSFTYHAKMQTGELIQRSTSDVDALRRFFSDQAIGVCRVILLFSINFAALLDLDVKLALISIIAIPVVLVVSFLFFKRISKTYEAYQEQEATLSTTLQENLSGVRVVKAFARQDFEKDKFEKDNLEKFKRGRRLIFLNAMFWPITDTLCGLQMIGGFLVGALMAIDGTITLGTYMAYLGLIGAIIFPMRSLGRLIVQISTGTVSYHRVATILKEEREPLLTGEYQPDGNVKGDFKFDHVNFEYEADTPVIKDVSFHCRPGQMVALMGSTGSGKTSLVNLLPRFYDVTSGAIYLDDIDLRKYPRRFLRNQIGIVEQEPFLFSRTIRENITYGVGRNVDQKEIEAAARAAAIHDVIMEFPDGYDTLVGEKGVTLSGGQKQRVAIARTLLKNPRILILDDSTSSVDTETEAEIRRALEHLMQNRTSFVIAHRIQSVMNADQILVFDKGKVVQSGQHADLVNQPGIYRLIYDIQTRIETELEMEVASA